MEEGKVEYYKANYDIVKDYRYSVDKSLSSSDDY